MRRVFLISIIILSICCIVAGVWYAIPAFPGPEGIWEPNWSPDGNLIAFRCVFVSPDNLSEYANADSFEKDFYFSRWSDICVTDQYGQQFRKLTSEGNVSNFSWSPDGKMLAWAHEDDFVWETISIWNSQEQTTETFFLSEEIEWLHDLKWSKDGQQLYLGDSGAIFDIANKELLLVSKQEVDGNEFFGFTRSFDGEYLALERYMNFPDGQADLVITKDNKLVYSGYEFYNGSVYSWSPNSNVLAWTGGPIPKDLQDPEEDYNAVLFLTYTPTGETIKYEVGDNLFTCCDDIFWSSDGMKLAILDSYDIEIFEFSQSDHGFPLLVAHQYLLPIREIFNNYYYDDGGLSWSPDGKEIIIGYDYQLWLINIQDNSKQQFSIDYP